MSIAPKNDQHSSTYQAITRSGRRLTWWRQLLYRLGMPISMALVRAFWASYRIEKTIGDAHLDAAIQGHRAVIPVMWHQHLMIGVRYLLGKRGGGLKLGFMISPSVDGEAGAMAAQRLGGHVVRGSSSYTGARALRDFYLAIAKDNVSLLITPDGPRGPRYEAKSGALLIAQLANRPIVPIAYAATRIFKFRAWDHFVLPLPFARIVVAVGEPIVVPKVMSADDLLAWQSRLGTTLKDLFRQAHSAL